MSLTFEIGKIRSCLVILSLSWIAHSCSLISTDQRLNVLLICVDDLRPELRSFGADHVYSPNIDQLAGSGMLFQNHYVNAPSCGPSRFTLLTGQYGPAGNNALFLRADQIEDGSLEVSMSMPEWFKTKGYTTVSVGKVSHHPGGRGGADWNDSTIIEMPGAWDQHLLPVGDWLHPRGAMHGLAHGEIRKNPKEMDVFQSRVADDMAYPDGVITNEAINQLKMLSADKSNPFFLAVGLIKPHLPFGAPKKYYDLYQDVQLPEVKFSLKPKGETTWHTSGEFRRYNLWNKDPNSDETFADEVHRHYLACISYADAQVGKVLSELKKTGADKNTIVVLWGDHGWHLGEHAIWGKHSLYEEALLSPLIINYPDMMERGAKSSSIVETLDIFPTLCDLSGIEVPKFVQGRSLLGILENPKIDGRPAIAYKRNATSIRTDTHRLTVHENGSIELYDHRSPEKESVNVAHQHPNLVTELSNLLRVRLE